ncbi:hypothetical protein DERA104750_14820 [Deinococcus radiodurans]
MSRNGRLRGGRGAHVVGLRFGVPGLAGAGSFGGRSCGCGFDNRRGGGHIIRARLGLPALAGGSGPLGSGGGRGGRRSRRAHVVAALGLPRLAGRRNRRAFAAGCRAGGRRLSLGLGAGVRHRAAGLGVFHVGAGGAHHVVARGVGGGGVAGAFHRQRRVGHFDFGRGRHGRFDPLATGALHAFEHQLGHVFHDDVVALLLLGRGVHHGFAEGAAHRQHLAGAFKFGARLGGGVEPRLQFAEAVVGDALAAFFLFLPKLSAARTAAERVLALAFDVQNLPSHLRNQLAGRLIHAVVAAQVAGVVVDHVVVQLRGRQLARRHELLEVFGVVNGAVVAADLPVLVADGVHAVRAGRHDQLGRHLIERFHVFLRELLVQEFVPGAPGAVPGAGFLLAQHGVVHARLVEQLHEGAGHLLSAGVVARGAAHPVDHVGFGVFVDSGDFQALGPLHTLVARDAPGVAGAFHAAEGGLELRRELALHHHQVAADVHDVEHLLVLHRAHLHAGAAGGAGPHRFLVDGVFQQRTGGAFAGFERHGPEHEGVVLRRDHVQFHALVDFQRGGREGLAGGVRRAHVLTAVALNTGVGVEQPGPFQVFQFFHAQLGFLGLHRFFQALHGGQGAAVDGALERVVDRRHEDVDVLGEGEVAQEQQNAAQRPPEAEEAPALQGRVAQAAEQRAAHRRGERLEGVVVPRVQPGFLHHLGGVADNAAPDVEGDEGRDDQRVALDVVVFDEGMQQRLVGKAEVAPALAPQAANDQPDHADQHAEAQDVGQDVVERA